MNLAATLVVVATLARAASAADDVLLPGADGQSRPVSVWIAQLASKDARDRDVALRALLEAPPLDPASTRLLVAAFARTLSHPDVNHANLALSGLRALGPKAADAVPAMTTALERPPLYSLAAELLSRLPWGDVPVAMTLVTRLEHEAADNGVAQTVGAALAKHDKQSTAAVALLLRMAIDATKPVARVHAIAVLGWVPSVAGESVPLLVKALEVESLRPVAMQSLVQLAGSAPAAAREVASRVRTMTPEDGYASLQEMQGWSGAGALAVAIDLVGDPVHGPQAEQSVVHHALDDGRLWLPRLVERTLVLARTPSKMESMVSALLNGDQEALRAKVKEWKATSATVPLVLEFGDSTYAISVLEDHTSPWRARAASALVSFAESDKKARAALGLALADKDPAVRRAAAEALATPFVPLDRETTSRLVAAATDSDPATRKALRAALTREGFGEDNVAGAASNAGDADNMLESRLEALQLLGALAAAFESNAARAAIDPLTTDTDEKVRSAALALRKQLAALDGR